MTVPANDSSQWRAFEESDLTHSSAHYLMAVMHLRKQNGYARVTDVAEYLKVTRGAASKAILQLKERRLVQEGLHRMLELTDEGLERANTVERNYLILECLMEDVLGLPSGIAQEDACKIEHLLSSETTQALLRLVQILGRNKQMLQQFRDKMESLTTECDHKNPCLPCTKLDKCLAMEFQTDIPTSFPM